MSNIEKIAEMLEGISDENLQRINDLDFLETRIYKLNRKIAKNPRELFELTLKSLCHIQYNTLMQIIDECIENENVKKQVYTDVCKSICEILVENYDIIKNMENVDHLYDNFKKIKEKQGKSK